MAKKKAPVDPMDFPEFREGAARKVMNPDRPGAVPTVKRCCEILGIKPSLDYNKHRRYSKNDLLRLRDLWHKKHPNLKAKIQD